MIPTVTRIMVRPSVLRATATDVLLELARQRDCRTQTTEALVEKPGTHLTASYGARRCTAPTSAAPTSPRQCRALRASARSIQAIHVYQNHHAINHHATQPAFSLTAAAVGRGVGRRTELPPLAWPIVPLDDDRARRVGALGLATRRVRIALLQHRPRGGGPHLRIIVLHAARVGRYNSHDILPWRYAAADHCVANAASSAAIAPARAWTSKRPTTRPGARDDAEAGASESTEKRSALLFAASHCTASRALAHQPSGRVFGPSVHRPGQCISYAGVPSAHRGMPKRRPSWQGRACGTPGMCPFSEVKVLCGPGNRDR